MPSSPSPLLKVELQAAGENSNSWGTLANATYTRLEDSIAGRTPVVLSANYTLTDTQYVANESRAMILDVSGAGGFSITIPNRSKVYLIRNGSSGIATITTGSGTTCAIAAGSQEWVYCNGSNAVYPTSIPSTRITGLPVFGTIATFNETTAAQFQANTAGKALSTDKVWSAAAYVALTDAATIALDLSTGINFTVTLAGNRTLGAPTNMKEGQTGVIAITQDATGSRTLAYNAAWKFSGGLAPTLTATAGSRDLLFYEVLPGATTIFGNLVKAV